MFKIANQVIEVVGLNENEDISRLELFQYDTDICDISYRIHYDNDLEALKLEDVIYKGSQLCVALLEDKYYRYYHFLDDDIYAIVDEKENIFDIYLDSVLFSMRYHPYLIPSLFSLERILLKEKAIVFHSSYISYNDKAIVFSAPSGGGKSTQAELWKQYKNAKIINGDKSIIGLSDTKMVYGIPFSGSSDYCYNESHPIGAIIILEKGPENKIRKMGLDAFSRVLSQTTMNLWDEKYCEIIMDLISEMCLTVPIYLYSCTKEEDAVNYLYDVLRKDGVL